MITSLLLSNWKSIVVGVVLAIAVATTTYYKNKAGNLEQDLLEVNAELSIAKSKLYGLSQSVLELEAKSKALDESNKISQAKIKAKYEKRIKELEKEKVVLITPNPNEPVSTCDKNVDTIYKLLSGETTNE